MSFPDELAESAGAVELTTELVGVEIAGLAANYLSVRRALLTGLVGLQIGPSVALVGGALFVTAGVNSWLSIVLGIGLLLCVAEAVRVLSSIYVATGGIMSYVLRSCGYLSGLVVGAALVLGYVATAAALNSTTVLFTTGALADLGVESPDSTGIQITAAVVIGVLSIAVACLGLGAAVRVAAILGLACLPLVLWISVAATLQSGVNLSAQFDLSGTTPGLVVAGVLLILANLTGFDDLTTLAAETENPKRSIPRIISGVLIISGVVYVAATMTQMSALQANADALNSGASPVSILAEVGHVSYLAEVTDVLLVLACFASCVTLLIFGARLFATAASIGVLPGALERTSRRHSPFIAVVTLGAAGILLPVLLAALAGKTPLDAAIYFSLAIAYLWAPAYILTCIGAVLVLKRHQSLSPWSVIVLATGAVGFAWYLLDGLSQGFSNVDTALPWICVASVAVVYIAFLIAGRRAPSEARADMLDRLGS
jgi:amino acid transporter